MEVRSAVAERIRLAGKCLGIAQNGKESIRICSESNRHGTEK